MAAVTSIIKTVTAQLAMAGMQMKSIISICIPKKKRIKQTAYFIKVTRCITSPMRKKRSASAKVASAEDVKAVYEFGISSILVSTTSIYIRKSTMKSIATTHPSSVTACFSL